MAKAVFLGQQFDTLRWVEIEVMEIDAPIDEISWDALMMALAVMGNVSRLQLWSDRNKLVQDSHGVRTVAL